MKNVENLIIGGIYLTKNDNYLIVFNKVGEYYNIAHFHRDFTTQYHLQNDLDFIDSIYELYFIRTNSINIPYYFNNGYCGRITDNFLKKLQKVDPICIVRDMDEL